MKSLISRFLPKTRTEASARHIRLCLARFRHLLREYGRIIALCADAADKQSGQYIFDKAYIVALIDRASEAIEGMVYDLNALAGERYLRLYEDVETIRRRTAELFKAGSALSLAAENEEEPEYRLLRIVREILCRPEGTAPPLREGLEGPNFFGVLQFVLQAASDSIVESMMLFPRHLAEAPSGASFPIGTSIVDLTNMLAESSVSLPNIQSLPSDSVPTREFLTAFFSPSIWKDNFPVLAGPKSTNLVGYPLEESMNTAIMHDGAYDLFDAFLGCAPEANYIYCRFPSGPGPSLAERILTRLGFFVARTEHGLTGWIASQPLSETVTKLKMIAKLSAFLLQPSSETVKQTEEDLIRLIGMHC